jgi:hypothetical protein
MGRRYSCRTGSQGWRSIAARSLAASLLVAFAALTLATGAPARRVSGAASSPLLLVTDVAAADHFGPYLGEILRAEGLPTFATADVATLGAMALSSYSIVLLGPVAALSAGQAAALTAYVQGGGSLIAMRPPPSLAPLFGVAPAGGTTDEGYAAIAPNGLGSGFNTTPLQVHARADNYSLTGATPVAMLYTSAATATAYPAVTLADAGRGRAMLWAYDLAQSVVFTRQGSPDRVGEHDGYSGYRTTDLFAGYVDLNDVPIPQADEQQRLLAKAILALAPAPMPHLWYFPQNAGTVLVLTGDAHGTSAASITSELSTVQTYGGHITLYLAQAGQPAASDVAAWKQAGHGVGIHPYASPSPPTSTGCGTGDGNGIGAGIANDQSWFQSRFGTNPSTTVRIHDFSWQCWSDAAATEGAAGLQMDTGVYPWGAWLKKGDGSWAHGYINGSGLPMQMVDATGHLISVYQQATALVDEQLVGGIGVSQENLTSAGAVAVSRQLIDAGLTGGNYAAITAQFQVDYFAYDEVEAWAIGTMAYAQSRGVPILSADDWLRFTKARASAALGTPAWDGSHLSFTVAVPSGPDALPLMLPLTSTGGRLASLTVDGSSVAYQTRTVKGAESAVLSIPPGSHAVVAAYAAATPALSGVAPTQGPIAGGTPVTIAGAHFDPLATVTFGGVGAASVQVGASGTSIAAVAPAHAAGAVDVAVTNPGGRTATLLSAFTYVPPPMIAAMSPQSGGVAGGGQVTITGTGFRPGAGATFGGVAAAVMAVTADGTRLAVTAPPHAAGTVDVAVTNPDGQRSAVPGAYTYGTVSPLPNQAPGAPAGNAPAPNGLPQPRASGGSPGPEIPNPAPAVR